MLSIRIPKSAEIAASTHEIKPSINTEKANTMLSIIQSCKAMQPAYKYPNEMNGYNPAYTVIDGTAIPLELNETRIWALRTDLKLVTGVKNAYPNPKNTSLRKKIHPDMHCLIDFNDRYGHPSLAIPENGYDGGVYYAGWLAQRSNRIEMSLFAGRYRRSFDKLQQTCLEVHIASELMKAYGKQNIVFRNASGNKDIYAFFKDRYHHPARIYTPAFVAAVFECEKAGGKFTADLLDLLADKVKTEEQAHAIEEKSFLKR